MCKLNCIIFLIFLVPHRLALVEGQLPLVDPVLTSMLLGEIDEFLNELSLNHKALLNSQCSKSELKMEGLAGNSSVLPMVQDKLKELKNHLGSQSLLKECEYQKTVM